MCISHTNTVISQILVAVYRLLFLVKRTLISLFGVCIITILLLCSSVILLTNHQHREVAKVVLENIKAGLVHLMKNVEKTKKNN